MRHKRIIYRLVTFLVVAPLLLIGIIHYQPIQGFQAQVVLSGSMEPAIKTGSVIFIRQQPYWQYRIGDIISFRPPIAKTESVTHRIINLSRQNGVAVMQTKGDANNSPDPWITDLGAITGRELLAIPYIGYPVTWIQTVPGFIILVLSSFFLCILPELIEIWQLTELSKAIGSAVQPEG